MTTTSSVLSVAFAQTFAGQLIFIRAAKISIPSYTTALHTLPKSQVTLPILTSKGLLQPLAGEDKQDGLRRQVKSLMLRYMKERKL
jgi:hypothetical protein